MSNITLLFHILGACIVIGMIVPDILIKRIYRETATDGEKIRLARLHLRLAIAATYGLLLIVLTGVGRTFEVPYSWFDFGGTTWLAIKQTLGLVLLVLRFASLPKIFALHADLGKNQAARLKDYESSRGRSHILLGTAVVLAALGVLKVG